MALFYSSGSRQSDLGKFHSRRRPGITQDAQHQHGEYRFELLSMESSTPVRRMHYHVRIYTNRNIRIEYLRDFSSAKQALAAAEKWVAERELTRRAIG